MRTITEKRFCALNKIGHYGTTDEKNKLLTFLLAVISNKQAKMACEDLNIEIN